MDISLNPNTGDLAFESFDFVVVRGADLVRQRLEIKLRTFRGEWFLNNEAGVPYFESIFRKVSNPAVVGSVFKSAILSTPGVRRLAAFEILFDPDTRTLRLEFTVISEDDESIPVVFTVTP